MYRLAGSGCRAFLDAARAVFDRKLGKHEKHFCRLGAFANWRPWERCSFMPRQKLNQFGSAPNRSIGASLTRLNAVRTNHTLQWTGPALRVLVE